MLRGVLVRRGPDERFPNVEVMGQALHIRPRQDLFLWLRQDLGIPLHPTGALTRAVLHGPTQQVAIQAPIGYTTIRGHDERALESQLLRHIRAEIRYRQAPDPHDLAREFDRVVIATGDQAFTRSLGLWQRDVAGSVRGARVRGDFSPNEMQVWLSTAYGMTGYGYLVCYDERHA